MSLEKFIQENRTDFDDLKMPEAASAEFQSRLKKELHPHIGKVRRLRFIKPLAIAASLALIIALGNWYQHKQDRLKVRDSLVLNLDESKTNSSRLETIYEIEDQFADAAEDEKILNAFFKILHSDSDANSKVAVIDALLKFPQNSSVRKELIDALGTEREPLVQLKLIKAVATLREQRAKVPLQKIIKDTETLPLVKGNASALLALLNQ